MTRERLRQILEEKEQRPDVFRASGAEYFIEALPCIEDYIALHEIPVKVEVIKPKKVEAIKIPMTSKKKVKVKKR